MSMTFRDGFAEPFPHESLSRGVIPELWSRVSTLLYQPWCPFAGKQGPKASGAFSSGYPKINRTRAAGPPGPRVLPAASTSCSMFLCNNSWVNLAFGSASCLISVQTWTSRSLRRRGVAPSALGPGSTAQQHRSCHPLYTCASNKG